MDFSGSENYSIKLFRYLNFIEYNFSDEKHSKNFFNRLKSIGRYDRSGSQICFQSKNSKFSKSPEWPPNDLQMTLNDPQWTSSEPPMTTNDNQLGPFWFPDVVKWHLTFKFLKKTIFPQFYWPNYCINSQNLNFLAFFHKETPTKN